jgi:ubiquinone/menaquinone biosynthesis C-methylase UbiE
MDLDKAKEILGGEFGFMADALNQVLSELNISSNAVVLDVGTGRGTMAIVLAINGFKVITGEPAEDYSEYAKKNWRTEAQKVDVDHLITYKPFSADNLPFDDDYFDAIFSYGSFHHIDDKKLALEEFLRTIKSNGVVCIMEPGSKIIEMIKKRNPTHPAAADPEEFLGDLKIDLEIKRNLMIDAFILKKARKTS